MALEKHPKIREIIAAGYDFPFGDYIERGIAIFKKNMGNYAGFALLFGAISVISSIIPIIGSLANALVITPALTGGFYLVTHKVATDQPTTFNDFFKGFDYWTQLLVGTLIYAAIVLLCITPMFISFFATIFSEDFLQAAEEANPFAIFSAIPFWSFIFLIPAVYFSVGYAWYVPFIVLQKMEAWDALEASRRLVQKHWWVIFAFSIVIGFIAMVGVIAFVIGLIFSIPAAYCMNYAAFADVTKLESEEDSSEIIDHLVV